LSKPVPVVLACQWLRGGGTERQMVELVKALDRSRFEPHVFCMIDDEATRRDLTGRGIPVQVLPVRTFAGVDTAKLAWSFGRYLRKQRIALFHAFDMPFAIFGAPVARLARTPVVLTSCRGHRALYEPKHQKMLRVSDRFTDGIVCNATALVEDLAASGLERERIHLCHNGLDIARFPSVRSESADGLTIGSVCVLRPEKNLQLLLRAFAALKDCQNLRLRITGSGPEEGALRALAGELGIVVDFHPAVSDIGSELAKIDVFVLPSLSEGLSNSIMEAMACGCTVAASAVGGNLELVKNRETGMLFDPGKVETLTAVLEELVRDGALRARLAGAGAEYVRSSLSMSASVGRMSEIYDGYLAAVS
jgi:L-malate glycosyltransferase